MQLIPKADMIGKEWLTFERYPLQNTDIVFHVRGYHIRENKFSHDFIRIKQFDAKTFDKTAYRPNWKSVVWKYTWLPTKALKKRQ